MIVSLNTERLATEAEKEKQMARSTKARKVRTTTARSTRPIKAVSVPRRATDRRTLKYFNFQYNRDDVSHERGANSVTITDRTKDGSVVSLSLQEARSLYDFLSSQFRSR